MLEREMWMHAFAYNLIHALLLEAAPTSGVPIERLSFKVTVDPLEALDQSAPRQRMRRALRRPLLSLIAFVRLPLRTDHSEPRARKRRTKNSSVPNLAYSRDAGISLALHEMTQTRRFL